MSVKQLLTLIQSLGPKLEEAWPNVKKICENINNILTIVNGGKPIISAGAPITSDGIELAQRLKMTGLMSEEEAQQTACSLEMFGDRVAA